MLGKNHQLLPQPEVYMHYKGSAYVKVGEALHTETEETLVIYTNTDGALFARPKQMFEDSVTINGQTQPRFTRQQEGATQ